MMELQKNSIKKMILIMTKEVDVEASFKKLYFDITGNPGLYLLK